MSPDERNDIDDEALMREYLEGDSSVSRLYRQHSDEQPGSELDGRIRGAAQRALAGRRKRASSPFSGHWMVPTSLAAVLVLSVSIVLVVPDTEVTPLRAPGLSAPPATSPAPAGSVESRARDALEEDAGEAGDSARVERAKAAKREAEMQPARESLRQVEPAAPTEPPASVERAPGSPPAADRSVPLPAPAPVEERAGEPMLGASGSATAPPLADSALRADPAAWLRYIEDLTGAGYEQQALANLRAFLARYPDHPLPPSLEPLARTLESERP